MSSPSDSKVPAPVLKARQVLQNQNLPVTKENIEKHLDPTDINKLMGSMRTALGKPGNEKQKQSFATAADKRACLASYILDPDVSKCEMLNSHAKEITSGSCTRRMWLTLAQMASPMLYNSMEDAELIAKDLPERDHEKPSMAAAGKKQYEVEVTEEVFSNLNKDRVDLASKADISGADYQTVRSAMEEPASKRPKKRIIDTPPTEEELQKQAALEAKRKTISAHSLALGSLKRSADRARKLAKGAEDQANSLHAKGYPPEMIGHFVRKVKPLHDAATQALDSWTSHCKDDLSDKSIELIDTIRDVVENSTKKMEDAIKDSEPIRKEISKVAK
jgi:hypothetical protein